MKQIHTGSEEEKNMVLGEGLSQEKTVLPNLSIQSYDSPSVFNLDTSPFAEAFKGALGLSEVGIVEISEGDEVKIETAFSEPISGEIILIEGNHVTLSTGWTWEEKEYGIRNISNGTESHIIKSIGVIKNA